MRILIYLSMMNELKRLQPIFAIFNGMLCIFAVICFILNLFISINGIIFFLLLGITFCMFFVESNIFFNFCKNYTDKKFIQLYSSFLNVETFKQTRNEYYDFDKLRQLVLLSYILKDYEQIEDNFEVLKEWQNERLMFIKI